MFKWFFWFLRYFRVIWYLTLFFFITCIWFDKFENISKQQEEKGEDVANKIICTPFTDNMFPRITLQIKKKNLILSMSILVQLRQHINYQWKFTLYLFEHKIFFQKVSTTPLFARLSCQRALQDIKDAKMHWS